MTAAIAVSPFAGNFLHAPNHKQWQEEQWPAAQPDARVRVLAAYRRRNTPADAKVVRYRLLLEEGPSGKAQPRSYWTEGFVQCSLSTPPAPGWMCVLAPSSNAAGSPVPGRYLFTAGKHEADLQSAAQKTFRGA